MYELLSPFPTDIALFYSEKSKVDSEIVQQLSNCTDELKRLVQILTALRETPVKITDEGLLALFIQHYWQKYQHYWQK